MKLSNQQLRHFRVFGFLIFRQLLSDEEMALYSCEPEAAYHLAQADVPSYAFESQPGDVIVFNVAIWHAAFGGDNHRRQGVVVYYEDPDTPEATAAIQDQMRSNHGKIAQTGRPMYGPYWRSIANVRHQRWIRRLAELDSLETF